MQLTTMQPSFAVQFALSADEMASRIRSAIIQAEMSDYSISAGRCAEFFVDLSERRFWSPHLSIQIHDEAEGSELVGRFSPRPEVWTMVMFIYSMMIFGICGGAMLGWSQWFVNETPWGFWAIPVGIVVIAGLHAASLIGQRLSRDQMMQLHERLNHVLTHVDDGDSLQPGSGN